MRRSPRFTRRAVTVLLAATVLPTLAAAENVTIRLLVTTDLHGNIYPYDYYTGALADRGLAKVATLIRAARAQNPNTLLLDCGDTIQGAPLETLHQADVQLRGNKAPPDPMMLAMNALGFDALAVGNHEYNYGLPNLDKARREARFPWLSANTLVEPGAKVRPFAPYLVKRIAGVTIGIIGITTPGIPSWEEKKNYAGYRFEPGTPAARRALADLRAKHHPDLVILAAHAGLDDNATGVPGENMVREIAQQVPGIDAIVFGHTHSQVASMRIGDVLLMQPRNWGISLGIADFELARSGPAGPWKLLSKSSHLVPVDKSTEPDPEILKLAKPYHDQAERALTARVAESPADLSAATARVEDSALIDAIHQVQLHYAKADVSFASSFNPRVRIPKGPVTVREMAALYLYDNTLFAVEGTGKMVREALENSAQFYQTCNGDCTTGPLINPKVIGFNYDTAAGVQYQIDLTRPPGQRIVDLRYKGQPLDDNQPLRIAVNNYRAGGSAGYGMFKQGRIVWQSNDTIRDLMIRFYGERKSLPAEPDNNWRVVPATAAATLVREAAGEIRQGENK